MRAKPALLTFFLPCTAGRGTSPVPGTSLPFVRLLARLRSAAPYRPPKSDLITPAIVCTHTPITHKQRLLIPIRPPRHCIRDQTNMR